MADYYLGEIRAFACNFAPQDWALCDGSLLTIQQNQALFSLLGAQYGGDGKTNFALPDLRGRVPIGTGISVTLPANPYVAGNKGGSETVALQTTEMPAHNHTLAVKNTVGTVTLAGAVLAIPNGGSTQVNAYNSAAGSTTTLNPGTIANNVGGGGAHNNMQPFQTINFCIAIQGLYPQRP